MNFDEQTLVFSVHERSVPLSQLSSRSKTLIDKEQIIEEIKQLRHLSVRKIESALKKKGYIISSSTVANYMKEIDNKSIKL